VKRIVVPVVLALLVVVAVLFFALAPSLTEQRMNVVAGHVRAISPVAAALHQRLRVVDLHADSLLWGRDLLRRSQHGHVDLPRLVDGNAAVQVFDVVTKSPRHLNYERNSGDSDNLTPLAIAQRWPVATWGDLLQRALYQAHRLQDFSARSDGKLRLVRTRLELDDALSAHARDRGVVGALLGLEGAQALGGDVANLALLYDAGYRILSPSHFFDTEIGGSSAGVHKGGLTAAGKAWLREMESRHLIVDLAHASHDTIRDVLALATRPVIVSHGGLRGACENNRNLTDDEARGVAKTDGLIGIGYWPVAVCGDDAAAIARAIVYGVKLVGVEHIALGSDFDGAVQTPFDVSGVAQVTDALLAAGLDENQVARVMGENAIELLRRTLP
jgi:microsomal dipeptidase-like Zn-dependent dipeptidase